MVKLTRKDLGPHAMIHVVAVDPLGTTYRTRQRCRRPPAQFVDLRLQHGLDPTRHFTQQKQVTVAGDRASVRAAPTSRPAGSRCTTAWPRSTRSTRRSRKDPKLTEFAFILTWPKLKPEEKRALYSKYACHELNFFLLKKDPQFFGEVVKPYLTNKKDKTFLDHYLLGDDLSALHGAVGIRPAEHGRARAARAANRWRAGRRRRGT